MKNFILTIGTAGFGLVACKMLKSTKEKNDALEASIKQNTEILSTVDKLDDILSRKSYTESQEKVVKLINRILEKKDKMTGSDYNQLYILADGFYALEK